jgi:hypothetical protein
MEQIQNTTLDELEKERAKVKIAEKDNDNVLISRKQLTEERAKLKVLEEILALIAAAASLETS